MPDQSSRYGVLDSFRALAALSVVVYHYFYRWADLSATERLIPATPVMTSNPLVQHGFLGVEFFFLISGFVIALTLSRTASAKEFAVNRFARLFPAMLACAALTFVVARILGVEPFSSVLMIDFLPSLTFVSPQVYADAFGIEASWISDVYWSLFVELKFYLVAALIYFISPEKFVRSFFAVSSLLCGIYWYSVLAGSGSIAYVLDLYFFPKYAFLFAAGIAFYDVHGTNRAPGFASIGIVILSALYTLAVNSPLNPLEPSGPVAVLLIAAFFVLFVAFVTNARMLAPLETVALTKIGLASYSLYLLHEGIGVPLISRLNAAITEWSYWPFLVAALMISISLASYQYVEEPARRFIRKLGSSHS